MSRLAFHHAGRPTARVRRTFTGLASQLRGNPFITLESEVRGLFWRFVEEHAASSSPIRGLRKRGVRSVTPVLRAEVRHLKGGGQEEALLHGTLRRIFTAP